nr:hypothetical protein [Tanacetum cinerariifolium]
VNYAGCFTESPGRRYVNGDFAYFDCIDIDEFSVYELNDMVKKIDDAYNTPKHKCLIMEIPEGVSPINASPVSKMKPRRLVSGICAKKLLLGWKQKDVNFIGESSSRLEDGESSQPNTANPTTQTDFANDFYSTSNPYLEVEDFDPFFGLDSEHVDATIARNECVGKGKWVALNDDQIHVKANKTIENETADGNSDGDTSESSEHDEFVDTDNQLVVVEVDMDHFDTTNAKTMGNDGTPEFNAKDVFDIGIDSKKIKYCTADFLSEDIIDQIETNPEIPVKAIQEQLQRRLWMNLRLSTKSAMSGWQRYHQIPGLDHTSQLVDGRDRPIISILEYAREYLMKRIMNVKQVIERSDGPLTPTATRLFNVIKAEASQCIANFNEGSLYGVTRQWGKVGLPESWVHPCYRLDTWKQVYSHHINHIRGKIMWSKSPIPATILPPNHHPQVGRPPKKRKKSAGEDI